MKFLFDLFKKGNLNKFVENTAKYLYFSTAPGVGVGLSAYLMEHGEYRNRQLGFQPNFRVFAKSMGMGALTGLQYSAFPVTYPLYSFCKATGTGEKLTHFFDTPMDKLIQESYDKEEEVFRINLNNRIEKMKQEKKQESKLVKHVPR